MEMQFSAGQLAEMLGGVVEGDSNVLVSNFSKIEEGGAGTLSFLANPKYSEYIYTTKASVVLVSKDLELHGAVPCTLVRVADPYSSLAQLMRLADQYLSPKRSGIDSTAVISDKAKIGQNVYIGPYVVIEDGAVVGDNAQIYAHSFIGMGASVGNDVTLYHGVTIYKGCKIGDRCILHAGCVIGSDGFGFAPNTDGTYSKIPQLGIVIVESDVEIGANATLDRSTMGATLIKKGVKLDNLVHIAHNVVVGENTVMAAMTGIAGSTEIGRNCMFGGQSGAVGHLKIADFSTFAARCGVANTIKEPGKQWHFHPHIESSNFRRSFVCLKQLPDTVKVVSNTERELKQAKERIAELENKISEILSKIENK